MTGEVELLEQISNKLSQLIVLARLSSSKIIAETKEEIEKDPVSQALLALSDGSLSSTQIAEKAMEQAKASERTVRRRIAELVEKGALTPVRKGKEIYYENSGLY